MNNIIDPTVLFVTFEQDEGNWIVKIPHAYGKDKPYKTIISEKLSLQFQPRSLVNQDGSKKTGVVCYPLISEEPSDG